LIISQEETERSTQTKDQIIHVLARFIFSSSPQDIRYKIPLSIKAMTAKTATYLISSDIRLLTKVIGANFPETAPPLHQGRLPHSIVGAAKLISKLKRKERRIKKSFFIGANTEDTR